MSLKSFLKREKFVALHGQSKTFRIRKYIILSVVIGLVYYWKGWNAVAYFLVWGAIAGICLHFFFRWKTQAWTKSWGLYKKILLTNEDKIHD